MAIGEPSTEVHGQAQVTRVTSPTEKVRPGDESSRSEALPNSKEFRPIRSLVSRRLKVSLCAARMVSVVRIALAGAVSSSNAATISDTLADGPSIRPIVCCED
jgi:hypothetical protein